MTLNNARACFIVSSIELLHKSKTLNTLLTHSYVDPEDYFMNILKGYALNDDVARLNALVDEFVNECITVEKYSPIDFMCYYAIPKIWEAFGNIVEIVLNEIYFHEFFTDRCKYTYTKNINDLLKMKYVDDCIRVYERFTVETDIKIKHFRHRPFSICVRNGHATLSLLN